VKRFAGFLLAFIISVTPLLAFGASSKQKIEQVYSNMPEIVAYVKADASGENILGYMNSKELEFLGGKPFNREDGISFVFMFDCSTSVSSSQMAAMKKCVSDFIENDVYKNDKFVIVAFGETVEVVADGKDNLDTVLEAVASMKNNQNATVLYDAVSELNAISAKMDDSYPKKSMGVVFTDAVDYTVGGITRDELLDTAAETNIPLYVVAINPGNKASVDMLGQVARKSGGEISVAKNGDIASAFDKVLSGVDGMYELTFEADTNEIKDAASTLRVVLKDFSPGITLKRKFVTSSWKEDHTVPEIKSIELASDKSIRVEFTEDMKNANVPGNYTVKKGSVLYKVSGVSYNEKTNTAVVSFANNASLGKYTISFTNITDCSMEKNPVKSPYAFKISGFRAFLLTLTGGSAGAGIGLVFLALIILVIVLIVVLKKKKTAVVMVDGKPTYADEIKYEVTPAKPLPSKYVQFVMETADGAVTNLDINIVKSIIFGRAQSCEVTIDDASLSRQHFAVELEDGELFIQNLSETNGTFVNGVALNAKRKLALGDTIAAGQERFVVNKI